MTHSTANPTLGQMHAICNSILKTAIKAEKLNQKFFWAASEMVTPEVNLKMSYNSKASFLKIMSGGKNGAMRDAFKFVDAMERSYNFGSAHMSPDLRQNVSAVLGLIREKHPSLGMAA